MQPTLGPRTLTRLTLRLFTLIPLTFTRLTLKPLALTLMRSRNSVLQPRLPTLIVCLPPFPLKVRISGYPVLLFLRHFLWHLPPLPKAP